MPGRGLLKLGKDLSLAAVFDLSGGVMGLASPMSVDEYFGGMTSSEEFLTSDVDTAISFSSFDMGTSSRVEE